MEGFLDRKVKQPLLNVIKGGISAQKLALSFAFGITCGVFPVPGLTTVPVILMTFLFQLNPAAPLTVNYICTPLNLASVPVFIHYGHSFFGNQGDDVSFSPTDFLQQLKLEPLETLSAFKDILLHGILAWLAFLPIASLVLYILFLPITHWIVKSFKKHED